jgi:hypothetical protein
MKRAPFLSLLMACTIGVTSCANESPVQLLLASSQSQSGLVRMALEQEASPVDSVPNTVTFDVRGPLPDLGDRLLAWSIGRRRKPAGELAKIAVALNINGVTERVDDNSFVIKDAVNPERYANLFVDEAGGWWTFSSGAQQSAPGCADPGKGCDTTSPAQTSLLSTGEAIRRTNQILARADMVPTNYPLSAVQANGSTTVTGFLTLGGVETNLATQFIFDANGDVVSASGPMIAIAMAGRFPILTPAEAVKRLNNPAFALIGAVTRLAADSVSSSPSSSGTSSSETVVPITGVRFILMETKLANLTHMLLPAYTFFNTDGDVGTVLAITDDHLAFRKNAVVSTDTVPVSGGDMPPTQAQPLDENSAQQLLGLPESEATKVAMANGWQVRIAARDGEFFMLTQDYAENRVNLSVKRGKVIAITVG